MRLVHFYTHNSLPNLHVVLPRARQLGGLYHFMYVLLAMLSVLLMDRRLDIFVTSFCL